MRNYRRCIEIRDENAKKIFSEYPDVNLADAAQDEYLLREYGNASVLYFVYNPNQPIVEQAWAIVDIVELTKPIFEGFDYSTVPHDDWFELEINEVERLKLR